MEKRTIIAALMSAIILSLYSQYVLKAGSQRSAPPELQQTKWIAKESYQQISAVPTSLRPLFQEEILIIESPQLRLEIGKTSGSVRQAVLKEYLVNNSRDKALEFSGAYPLIHIQIGSGEWIGWQVVSSTSTTVELKGSEQKTGRFRLSYSLSEENPVLDVVLAQENGVENAQGVLLTTTWMKGDSLSDRNNPLEAVFVSGDGANTYKRIMVPVRGVRDVPRGTFLASLAERYFCQSMRLPKDSAVKVLPTSSGTVATETTTTIGGRAGGKSEFHATIYLGPRDFFHLQRAGFGKAFKIGVLGQIGLVLVKILEWTARITRNYGVALILLSIAVTSLMAPFTLLGFRSMKKMQQLKPEIDKIMARHNEDPKKANVEVFALYKQHRVSPLSGCLPMLLQMPIFIALFQAISHYIGLRGARFFWITDLSLPDRVARLPVAMPFLGSDVNILPIIMAGAMYLQTKMSQQSMGGANNNPSAKIMSGPLMSVIFGVMFYQFPAGLVLYWLTNSIMSLLWYRLAA